MRGWFQGKRGGFFTFVAISVLVVGGLGWVTRAALRLEQEQRAQQQQTEHVEKLRLALWRLDSRIGTILAREDSRPFTHYSAIFAPPQALDPSGRLTAPGSVLEPSPLLDAELPPWMLLHFQADERGWESPQVLSPTLHTWLTRRARGIGLRNVTEPRRQLLEALRREMPGAAIVAQARRCVGETTIRDRVFLAQQLNDLPQLQSNNLDQRGAENLRDFANRSGVQSRLAYGMNNSIAMGQGEQRINRDVARLHFQGNGAEWLDIWNGQLLGTYGTPVPKNGPAPSPPRRPLSAEVPIHLSPMVGLWLPAGERERLVVLRMVRVEKKEVCQGLLIDEEQLKELLAEEVQDLFPGARLEPAAGSLDETLHETMTTLPLRLDPGPIPPAEPTGWTPLRLGLSLAWAAALVALVAVGLGGWSLLDLSERRIRFVSAVTHELRTPLTTLRLYLDMLRGGMIQHEEQRRQYLETLEAETDRLSRLVGNVLDFSRLENQSPRLARTLVTVGEVIGQTEKAWIARCQAADKELQVESHSEACLETDAALLIQVLGNLLDNACKYSRGATDRRIWLRTRDEPGRVVFEVEDRGPGVPVGEQQTIFRPFRRGRASDAITGGVGLGLALAERWTRLLGGRLLLTTPAEGGACFRVEMPGRK